MILSVDPKRFALTDGKNVMLGMRPADFSASTDAAAPNTLTAITNMIEFHGDQVLVGFPLGDGRQNDFVPARARPQEGQVVSFRVEEAMMHLFDADTGLSLLRGAG